MKNAGQPKPDTCSVTLFSANRPPEHSYNQTSSTCRFSHWRRSYWQTINPKPQMLTRYLSTANSSGVTLYLRRATIINSLRHRLLSPDNFHLPADFNIDSFIAAQTIRSAASTSAALTFFRSLPSDFRDRKSVVSLSLLKRLSLSKQISRVHQLLENLHVSPLDRLRFFSLAGDVSNAVNAWHEIRSAAEEAKKQVCTESYNLIMYTYSSNGMDMDAVNCFISMIKEGANPNSRTYTVMIEHLVRLGKVDLGLEVFGLLPVMRIRRTSKQYNVLAHFLSNMNRFKELDYVVKEMKSDGILPGKCMREAILKLRHAGFTDSSEEFVDDLYPSDKIAYIVGDEDEEEEEGDDDVDEREDSIRLKRWMDPLALARALKDWDPVEVKVLEAAKFVWTPRLVCKMLRGFKKPEPAWEFFCWVSYQPGNFNHDTQTVSRMISILARSGHVELVDRLISKLKSESIKLPFSTVKLAIDFYGLCKKSEPAIKLYRNASSICGPLSQLNRVLLSSSLLRTMAKCERKHEITALVEEMMEEGVMLDIQTFSGLMQYFAEEGDLKNVHRLFGLVRQCGLEPDGYMYRVLIRAYCKNERSAIGLRVFEEMMNSGLVLDRGSKEVLVKSLWKEGRLREAALVEEKYEGVEDKIPLALPGHVWTEQKSKLCACGKSEQFLRIALKTQ